MGGKFLEKCDVILKIFSQNCGITFEKFGKKFPENSKKIAGNS